MAPAQDLPTERRHRRSAGSVKTVALAETGVRRGEAQLLASSIEIHHQVRMVGERCARRHHAELAGHTEMDYQILPFIKNNENPLAPAADLPDAPPDQMSLPFRSPRPSQRPRAHFNRGQATAEEYSSEVPPMVSTSGNSGTSNLDLRAVSPDYKVAAPWTPTPIAIELDPASSALLG